MGEIFFVLKSFAISVLVILCLQIQSGGVTLEEKAEDWIRTSPIGRKLGEVAQGASLAVRHLVNDGTNMVRRTIGAESPTVQKAGRLNLELQRSPAAQKAQQIKDSIKEEF